jgi:hypothetical protein
MMMNRFSAVREFFAFPSGGKRNGKRKKAPLLSQLAALASNTPITIFKRAATNLI